jgi:hypothetical protein
MRFQAAAAVLLAGLIPLGVDAAEKPSPKHKRADAYPGSLKFPMLGGLSGKLGSSVKSTLKSQQAQQPATANSVQDPSLAETPVAPKTSILTKSEAEPERTTAVAKPKPLAARSPAIATRRPVPPAEDEHDGGQLEREQIEAADAADQEATVTQRSAASGPASRLVLRSVPVREPDSQSEADESDATTEAESSRSASSASVEMEFAEPVRPSQLSDEVRHGPVRRPGTSHDLLQPAALLAPAPSRNPADDAAERRSSTPAPVLDQIALSADDSSGKLAEIPHLGESRHAPPIKGFDDPPVADSASPGSLTQAVSRFETRDEVVVEARSSRRPGDEMAETTQVVHKVPAASLPVGTIESIDLESRTATIRFPAGFALEMGSFVKVTHKSLLRTTQPGELKIVGMENGRYLARPVGSLKINRLARGDRVTAEAE